MFSQASVILSTIGLMATQSLLILVGYSVTVHHCYSAVGTHPTGMLSSFLLIWCWFGMNANKFKLVLLTPSLVCKGKIYRMKISLQSICMRNWSQVRHTNTKRHWILTRLVRRRPNCDSISCHLGQQTLPSIRQWTERQSDRGKRCLRKSLWSFSAKSPQLIQLKLDQDKNYLFRDISIIRAYLRLSLVKKSNNILRYIRTTSSG